MTVLITLTTAGADSGPFDLYSNLDGYVSAFATGVSKASLLSGYSSSVVPDYTTTIRIKSNGVCTNYIDISLVPLTVCDTLGEASSFAIVASSTITNTGSSSITGNVGLYPGTSITGFPPGIINGVQHIADTLANTAKTDASNAFICLDTLATTGTVTSDIGEQTLTPGVYDTASSLGITGTLILDGQSDPNAVFIFKIPSTFIPSVSSVITLINGAQSGNIYWLVGSSATLNSNSTIYGNIIAQVSVTINSSATLIGRAIALTGAVTLDSNIVLISECTINPCIITTTTTTTAILPVTGLIWDTTVDNSCDLTPWEITNSNLTIKYNITNSVNCGGTCDTLQAGTATATITVGAVDVNMGLTFDGIGELEQSEYEKIIFKLDGVEIANAHAAGGGLGCAMGPVVQTFAQAPPYLLLANSVHTLFIDFSTNDPLFHVGSFYEINLSFTEI